MSKDHRCIECKLNVLHEPEDLCPSCGRCDQHCNADNHEPMSLMSAQEIGLYNQKPVATDA